MEEKEKVITVVDKRHFTKEGVRRNDVPDEEEKSPKQNPSNETAKKDLPKEEKKSDPSFGELITFIAHNALAALGKLPGALGNGDVNLEAGATMIEWLDAIQRKSKGNLSAEEEKVLRDYIYELKMIFIEARQGKK